MLSSQLFVFRCTLLRPIERSAWVAPGRHRDIHKQRTVPASTLLRSLVEKCLIAAPSSSQNAPASTTNEERRTLAPRRRHTARHAPSQKPRRTQGPV